MIRSITVSKNKGVVTARNAGEVAYDDVGDWVPARLRPVSGDENKNPENVKLPHSHEIVLALKDVSGAPVVVSESDIIDIRYCRNGEVSSDRITGFKIVGAIQEIRKNTKVVSYVLPVTRDVEY